MTTLFTMDEVANRLHYDAETGVFTWRVKPSAKVAIGAVAGKVRKDGYRIIKIGGQYWYAHRLAWFLTHGRVLVQLDHINGKRDDNRIANLREATAAQNTANQGRRSNNKSGFKGVSFSAPHQKWRARIIVNGRGRSLGYFATAEQASEAYVAAAKRLHGPYARSE